MPINLVADQFESRWRDAGRVSLDRQIWCEDAISTHVAMNCRLEGGAMVRTLCGQPFIVDLERVSSRIEIDENRDISRVPE